MTTTTNAADQFLMGGGSASAKFEAYGDTTEGTIVDPPEVSQQTDPKDGSLKFWPSGDPRMQLIVTLQTTLKDDPDDDGKRRIYIKGKSLTEAVREAVRASGAKGLEVGGTLSVTYVAEGPQQNKALNPPKLYTAAYKRPDTTQATGEFLGVTPQPAPAAVPSTQPAQPTPQQVAALKAAGIDPATVFPQYVPF
jgi:hypothetical protein